MDTLLLLVDQGADVKTPNGQKALMLAETQQDQHAIKKLINAGAEAGITGESNAGGNAPPSRGNLPGLKASENRYAQAIIA
ncbi:hypothetical protein H633G_05890 [Metarhizium anisopliae BRIP 53284]|nr:hypothetical protein H633G_05890 [Metarhizium anisopliae BRIP 53284]